MALKKYRVTDEAENYVELMVDTDKLTPQLATEINDFLSSPGSRLDAEHGDIERVVVRLFGSFALRFFYEDGGFAIPATLSEEHSRSLTEELLDWLIEGWPTYDALGIKIIDGLVMCPDFETVTVEEFAS